MLKKRFAEDQFYKMLKLRILSLERGEPRLPVPEHYLLCLYRGGHQKGSGHPTYKCQNAFSNVKHECKLLVGCTWMRQLFVRQERAEGASTSLMPTIHFENEVILRSHKMAGSSGNFRSYVWDPLLIISQIIAVQFTFYFFLGAWLFSIDKISGRFLAVNQIFDGKVS